MLQQIKIGGDCTPGSIENHNLPVLSSEGVSTAASGHDGNVYPNLIQVLDYIQSSGSLE